jgi:hypothetical protein
MTDLPNRIIKLTRTLSISVTKQGGPVATSAEVTSTGSDDESFSDSQLTPGPALKPLDPANSYTIVWTGAFAGTGSATLIVENESVTVEGNAGDEFFRIVMVP